MDSLLADVVVAVSSLSLIREEKMSPSCSNYSKQTECSEIYYYNRGFKVDSVAAVTLNRLHDLLYTAQSVSTPLSDLYVHVSMHPSLESFLSQLSQASQDDCTLINDRMQCARQQINYCFSWPSHSLHLYL